MEFEDDDRALSPSEFRNYMNEDEFSSDSDEEFLDEPANTNNDSEDNNVENQLDDNRLAPRTVQLKSQNVAALVRGNLVVKRQSLLPRVLSVLDREAVIQKPFKPPSSNGYSHGNEELTRRLWARKRFVPWVSTRRASVPITVVPNAFDESHETEKEILEESGSLQSGVEPLILWQSEEPDKGDGNSVLIAVDPLLVNFLRPHQREGIQFMFECVSGLCEVANIYGCILADDMGLGKTLQSISLLYTLLHQGFDGKPMVKKAIIVTPTSLVSNWEAEIVKWVGERVKLVALCESTRDDVLFGIDNFTCPHSPLQVLIVSYETFRMHSSKFNKNGSCDLLICDEAHRLKNDQTLTNRALASLPCKRRILLSGTPMQNDLEEFYAMVNFTNPGILGDVAYFRRHYETPIICGREPTASEEEKRLSAERSAELSAKVNQFILRRTNALLSNHLPPKIVEVVCCKLSPLQLQLYNHFIHSKNVKRAIIDEAKQSKILAYITALKKLCNHPKLIYDTIKSGSAGISGFDDCLHLFPSQMFSARSGTWMGGGVWAKLSGKMHVLSRLLAQLRLRTDDRIVLVSNYTQTLDLFAQLCREMRYPFLRLDGTTSISKRQKLVNRFNDPSKDEFAFLLSSKAGGCGLNLIGGNRLVLFDPDWNPANDKQAAARVWRDGQKKRVYIYRFVSTGTIEEKVYQRQMSKEGLQKVIQQETDSKIQGNFLSTEDLRDLFSFHENARSDIHEKMHCVRCQKYAATEHDLPENMGMVDGKSDQCDIGGFAGIAGCLDKLKSSEKQVGSPKEEDLANWGHHFSSVTVPDPIFQASAGDEVSFVFTNQISGKLAPVESTMRPTTDGAGTNRSLSSSKKNLVQMVSPQHKKPLQFSSDEPSTESILSDSLDPSEKPQLKLVKTSDNGIHKYPKSEISLVNQLPRKRLSSDCIIDNGIVQ